MASTALSDLLDDEEQETLRDLLSLTDGGSVN